jgi:hypothetical protein
MHVTDPLALRAMAHPLRLDLIELLGTVGPCTAAECARQIGSTQANCSYHLRQLAKYGFVELAEASADSRERPWRLTDVEQQWSGEGPAAAQMESVFVQREAERVLAWNAGSGQPKRWREAAFIGGASLPLTSDEVRDIHRQLSAVIEPYVARLAEPALRPDGYRFVRILLAATPGAEQPVA